MSLTEKTEVGKIEVSGEFNHVHVRVDNIILKDGEEVSRTYRRYVISPLDDFSNEEEKVKNICSSVFTDEIKNAYSTYIAEKDF